MPAAAAEPDIGSESPGAPPRAPPRPDTAPQASGKGAALGPVAASKAWRMPPETPLVGRGTRIGEFPRGGSPHDASGAAGGSIARLPALSHGMVQKGICVGDVAGQGPRGCDCPETGGGGGGPGGGGDAGAVRVPAGGGGDSAALLPALEPDAAVGRRVEPALAPEGPPLRPSGPGGAAPGDEGSRPGKTSAQPSWSTSDSPEAPDSRFCQSS
mmetsp:Transcript_18633/g.47869  ORF Transcript_18633/g.47869 Transcript_18633/m.47869 type:complete len:213 (-) Transcript_18633:2070-2708(-)